MIKSKVKESFSADYGFNKMDLNRLSVARNPDKPTQNKLKNKKQKHCTVRPLRLIPTRLNFQAHGILHNRRFVTKNTIQIQKHTALVINPFLVRSENSTEGKLAFME